METLIPYVNLILVGAGAIAYLYAAWVARHESLYEALGNVVLSSAHAVVFYYISQRLWWTPVSDLVARAALLPIYASSVVYALNQARQYRLAQAVTARLRLIDEGGSHAGSN